MEENIESRGQQFLTIRSVQYWRVVRQLATQTCAKLCILVTSAILLIKCWTVAASSGWKRSLKRNLMWHHLRPSTQCTKGANKARHVLRIVESNFPTIDKQDFDILYKYGLLCIQAWSPCMIKDIQEYSTWERATKWVKGFKNRSYTEQLKLLNLTTLENEFENRRFNWGIQDYDWERGRRVELVHDCYEDTNYGYTNSHVDWICKGTSFVRYCGQRQSLLWT